MGPLAALIALLCVCAPAFRAEGCSSFRHLENGQTFFRYGGLLVIFRCHPGYRLHGYKTNSCVSGRWSRETPVCVGSGCSNPGPLTHGTCSMNEDRSWATFSCNSGFRLHGPSMLYCKGHIWNSTKPVCKEFDMMSSISGLSEQKPNIHQNLQASVVLKTQQQSHYSNLANTVSKETNFNKYGLLSHTPSQMSSNDMTKVHLLQNIQFPSYKVKDETQTPHHGAQRASEARGPEPRPGSHDSEIKASHQEAEKVDKVTQMFAAESPPSSTISPTLSSVSGAKRSTFSAALTPTITAATVTAVKQTIQTVMFPPTLPQRHHTKPALPELGSKKVLNFGEPVSSWDHVTSSEAEGASSQTADEDQPGETGFQIFPFLSQARSEKTQPTETSTNTKSTSANISTPASSAFSSSPSHPSLSSPSSNRDNVKAQLPNVTRSSNTSTISEQKSNRTEHYNLTMNSTSGAPLMSLSLSRRPVCPYPPVPAHGTFYFRNVENPGPREYRHYIQYACYPGYTLAHGDTHSYCQQGGTWSGITPVCLELTPCSVNNGGCSQLCSHSPHHNQSSNQTQTRTQCHCRPGFILLDDGRTCRDLDECVEGLHKCHQRCINTFGSFKCNCDDGYQPATDQTSCTDVDECLLPAAVTGCVFGCVNTPGSFYCQCPAGYSLQSAESHCEDIDECASNQGLGPCMERCHNSPGSYRCSCPYGHVLAGNGHSCIAECPPGYRKQLTTTPENSTAQALREECVDINECEEGKCEWQCVNLPGSHRCICPKGYTLQSDGRHCKDINECSRKNGGCSHLCLNQKGGYKCACPASHRLSPYSWKKCLPRTTTSNAAD